MKKIRITESELVDLIEKLVKENIGNGTGFNFGMLGTPTSKYKELEETEAHGEFNTKNGEEEGEEEVEEEFNYDTSQTGDKTVDLNVMKQTNQSDWMGESITESQLIKRLKKRLIKEEGKGCAKSEGGDGCIDKDGKGWFIWNNKKGGIFKRCSSEKDCEEILSVPAVHG